MEKAGIKPRVYCSRPTRRSHRYKQQKKTLETSRNPHNKHKDVQTEMSSVYYVQWGYSHFLLAISFVMGSYLARHSWFSWVIGSFVMGRLIWLIILDFLGPLVPLWWGLIWLIILDFWGPSSPLWWGRLIWLVPTGRLSWFSLAIGSWRYTIGSC